MCDDRRTIANPHNYTLEKDMDNKYLMVGNRLVNHKFKLNICQV